MKKLKLNLDEIKVESFDVIYIISENDQPTMKLTVCGRCNPTLPPWC